MDLADRRTLLDAVAAGTVSPEEAAARLHGAAEDGAPPPDETEASGPGAEEDRAPLSLLRVEASAVPVRITGDPDVREVDVTGPHRLHRAGGVLTVEYDLDDESDDDDHAFAFVVDGRQRQVNLGRALRHGRRRPLVVRAHPDTPLEVACSAASLSISSMRAALDVDVSAGSVRIEDLRGPLRARINAGSLRARGVLAHGSSRIDCDAGSVRLVLDPGSSVRVAVETHLGRSEIRTASARETRSTGSGRSRRVGVDGGRREVVVGDGDGELEVAVNMGSLRLDAS